jgi:hypothetical protein
VRIRVLGISKANYTKRDPEVVFHIRAVDAPKVPATVKPVSGNVEKYRRLRPAFELLREDQGWLGDVLHMYRTRESGI